MKLTILPFITIFLVSTLALPAQTSASQQYMNATQALKQGDAARAIRILEPIVTSGQLNGLELGRAWLLQGASYRVQGNYRSAQLSYDKAVLIMKNDPHAALEYAVVLLESGTLNHELGNLSLAEHLEKQSLQLSEASENHSEIEKAFASLADPFLDRGEVSAAEGFVSRAEREAHLTNEFDGDERADLDQLEGWIALKQLDVQRSISDYQEAIDLYIHHYGVNSVLTGWGYILMAAAYDQKGARGKAFETMQKGMAILKNTAAAHDVRYARAEIQYAQLLDELGQRSHASWLKTQGESTLHEIQHEGFPHCTR